MNVCSFLSQSSRKLLRGGGCDYNRIPCAVPAPYSCGTTDNNRRAEEELTVHQHQHVFCCLHSVKNRSFGGGGGGNNC